MTTSQAISTKLTDDERARNRFAARRAAAAACGVGVAEIQALSNGYAEGVAHRRSESARAALATESAASK